MPLYKRQLIVCGAALLGCIAVPAAADVRSGITAWEAGNFEAAVKEWRSLAEKGDADARFNMGQAYRLGRGVPADLTIARNYYQQAAAQGHEQAQANLGLILFEGGDRAGALPWLRKAADRGDVRAQYVLGTSLFNGDIVTRDWPRAYALMKLASAQGLPQATRNLAEMEKYIPAAEREKGAALAIKMEKDRVLLAKASTPALMPAAATPKIKPAAPVALAAKAPVKAPAKPVVLAAKEPAKPVPAPIAKAQAKPDTAAVPKQWPVPPVSTWNGTKATPGVQSPTAIAKAKTPEAKSAAAVAQTVKLAAAPKTVKTSLASPGGRWRVQLGAFPSQQAARSSWASLSGKMPALSGLQPFYEPYQAFTRLRVGPLAGKTEANKLCAAAKAVGQACFTVAP